MRGEEPLSIPPIIQPNDRDSFDQRPHVSSPPCHACGSPRQPGSRFCTACGVPFDIPTPRTLPHNRSRSGRALAGSHDKGTSFHCDNCGADVDVPEGGKSLRCPFCDSTYVVELSKEKQRRGSPEFVIGFAITREKALELYFEWLGKNSWFRPSDLTQRAMTDKQQGVYIPFWHFTMGSASRWEAMIGEYWYRTERYTTTDSKGNRVTRTRQVRETEWWPLSGEHRKYYSGYMVSASKGLPHAEALKIQPFQLSQLMRYRPDYLAGWLVEEYSVDKETALAITQNEFKRREYLHVQSFLPGDTHRNLSVSTKFELGGTDLVLLPVHVLSYRYRDQVFRFLVNGQTGKIYGEKPWSKTRITIAVVAVGILMLLLILIVIAMSHPRLGG